MGPLPSSPLRSGSPGMTMELSRRLEFRRLVHHRHRRRPFPFGVRRDVLALHDDGERAQAGVVADMGVIEDGGVRADEDAAPELDAPDLLDAVLVEMRLQG